MPKGVTLIAAVAANNVIGYENKLPWRLPEDMANFKRVTMGHSVIMGRRTFDSLYNAPLPGRENYVLTRDPDFPAYEGVTVCNHLWEAVTKTRPDREAFIIGGGGVYKEAMEIADKLLITRIKKDFKGDAWFPVIDETIWQCASIVRFRNHEFDWEIVTYIRRERNSNGTILGYIEVSGK